MNRKESGRGDHWQVVCNILSFVLGCKDRDFGMKLYNNQRNAQVLIYLSNYLLLPYMFRAFF
jgi:hypothetical protein